MGKKRSRFVQQQKYNQHLQNKQSSNMNHSINRTNKKIELYKQDYENSVKEIMDDFLKENDLNPNEIPNNSRILIYELLKKNIVNKYHQYDQYIKDHRHDENINEYYEAQKICLDSLEQINWIYDWTKPLKDEYRFYSEGETMESRLKNAEEKLKKTEKKFDSILDIPEIIEVYNDYICYLKDDFYKFCKFIIENDLDKYYIYISNTIKNLKTLVTEDPIKDFMVKSYTLLNEPLNKTEECEN